MDGFSLFTEMLAGMSDRPRDKGVYLCLRLAFYVPSPLTRIHKNKVFIYEKKIGDHYVYVEEIRKGRNKSLAFQSLRKRKASE